MSLKARAFGYSRSCNLSPSAGGEQRCTSEEPQQHRCGFGDEDKLAADLSASLHRRVNVGVNLIVLEISFIRVGKRRGTTLGPEHAAIGVRGREVHAARGVEVKNGQVARKIVEPEGRTIGKIESEEVRYVIVPNAIANRVSGADARKHSRFIQPGEPEPVIPGIRGRAHIERQAGAGGKCHGKQGRVAAGEGGSEGEGE